MTGSGDGPGPLNELSSDIDTLSENLLETYTNLLHLERVLRCQQESAPAPEDGSAPEQRWRRRRRSFQLAAAGDGLSERSGPPPPANGGPTAVDDTSPQDRLERRVTELEADVRRIDQEKEEIRVKYTTVLKRLRRLQVSSSENWDVKSPPSTAGDGSSPAVPPWSPADRPQWVGNGAISRTSTVSAGSTGGSGSPRLANGPWRGSGERSPPRPGATQQLCPSEGEGRLGVTAGSVERTEGVRSDDRPRSPKQTDGAPPNSRLRSDGDPLSGSTSRSGGGSPVPRSTGLTSDGGAAAADSAFDGSHLAHETADSHLPSESDSDFAGGESSCGDPGDCSATVSSTHPGRDSPPHRGAGSTNSGIGSSWPGSTGHGGAEYGSDRPGSGKTVHSSTGNSPTGRRSTRHKSTEHSSAAQSPAAQSPAAQSPAEHSPATHSPTGHSSGITERRSIGHSSARRRASRPGSSHSTPAAIGRPGSSGAVEMSATSPAAVLGRSSSHPVATKHDNERLRNPAVDVPSGCSQWSATEAAPHAGEGSREAVEDQIRRLSAAGLSPTRQPMTDSGGDENVSTENPHGSPVLSETSDTVQESISEEIPVPGSPPTHQPPPRAPSPKEDTVPQGDGGDTYTGGGGDICGSFRGWPTGGGSPPLLSPLVVFARPPDQADGVKSLCEVTDSATQTETEHRGDAETIAVLEAVIRRKDSVIATMQSNLAKVERQLVGTRQQLQTIEADVLRRLEEAEQSWRRKRRQLQVDLADERAVSQTLHAVEADLSEQLRRCRRRCAELEAGLPDRSERGAAAERGTETRRRSRSRRLATLCHQLTEHVGRLMAAQTRLTGELLSTLQQLFGLFTLHNPAVAAPCQEATLATLPLWLPWLAAEARLACRDRQQRHLDPVSPPEALPSPPVGGAPPHLSALVRQVWDDIERLRRLDLEEPASLGEVEDRPPPIEESME
ncbi:uncharacterized protein LOC122363831 [Amphibalanus amphitrite]|uniref:uncharacterized protein LOC122363831 n=1 Tax=Amphibalanus amphitrite TaxID=1232801 RepID=UPI001C8FFEF0|nr:uncharacterized protein LOC122363831 [Amphibalanus amphitrite]